ncbi:MAG: hypothetical protein DMF19_11995 [Verrucomicrobia bacterium]|nr:MAG: hypothetical protein DMF19_11995 [Verrucomicrobiota bacterium]
MPWLRARIQSTHYERIIGKASSAFTAVDCGENGGWLIAKNKNAFGRMATVWSFTHTKSARQSLALPIALAAIFW